MTTDQRRATARRRAWGRGPFILRFEPLEGRQLLATSAATAATVALADLRIAAFDTVHTADWGDTFQAKGVVVNQGTATVATPFLIDLYASPTPGLSPSTIPLGQVSVPAGLQPGQTASFDQAVTLPTTALNGVGPEGTFYVGAVADYAGVVPEVSKMNNFATGEGYDLSAVTITPKLSPSLAGASVGVYPDQARWGTPVTVTTQIRNDGPGDAPATRARIVLTPAGATPGGAYDMTVGNIDVPALGAFQTTGLSTTVNLPAAPPSTLAGSTQFILSVVQDADFVTNPISPHLAFGGLGYDMVVLNVDAPADTSAAAGPKADLAVGAVKVPTLPIAFGQTFQVVATEANLGTIDAGPHRVRFLLVGTDGSLNNALFLGDATVDGLKAGFQRDLVQQLALPEKLPAGLTLNDAAQAKIAVVVDPEQTIDEPDRSNNAAVSDVMRINVTGAPLTANTPAPTVTATTPTTQAAAAQPANAQARSAAAAQARASAAQARAAAAQSRAAAAQARRDALAQRRAEAAKLRVFPRHTA